MNKEIVKETIAQTLNGTITFPQVVAKLVGEGIESYHVDLMRMENRYYQADGVSLAEKWDLAHQEPAKEFRAAGVEAAVRKVQRGESNYRQFVDEILAAGCSYYIAFLSGKRVSYFGRNGDCHVEYFPQK